MLQPGKCPVAAAGCAANLVLAEIAITLLRVYCTETPTTRFFLWLLGTNNLLIPGGYMMVLTFVGIGDWNDFIQGLPNVFVWQLGITLLGVALIVSLTGLFWGARNIDPFLGTQKRGRRALTLTLTAYLAGATANTLAGILKSHQPAVNSYFCCRLIVWWHDMVVVDQCFRAETTTHNACNCVDPAAQLALDYPGDCSTGLFSTVGSWSAPFSSFLGFNVGTRFIRPYVFGSHGIYCVRTTLINCPNPGFCPYINTPKR